MPCAHVDRTVRSVTWLMQRRLRVLHVIARMPPAGTEHQLAGMVKAANGSVWDASLCVLHAGYALTDRVAASGVPIVELAEQGAHPAVRVATFRRLLLSNRFDIVHSSLWGANAFTRLVSVSPRRPAVVISERRVEEFRSVRRRRLDRALRPVTDGYVANSDAVRAFVERSHGLPPGQVHVVPNGIDREIFHPGAGRAMTGGRLRIGGVGRLTHQKGFDVLISALPKVLAEHDVEVEIAGQGELSDELRRRAAGLPVRFIGVLESPSAVADFLRSLDLFVMPSRYEGLPNAVLEAVACGVTVVATDAPGMRAAVGTAPLVPRDDADALASAITAALNGAPDRSHVAIPDFAQVADAHARVFEDALARRAAV